MLWVRGERVFVWPGSKVQVEEARDNLQIRGTASAWGYSLPRIGLAKAFISFRQEAKPFDCILKRGGIRKPLHDLKELLLDRFGSHRNHLM